MIYIICYQITMIDILHADHIPCIVDTDINGAALSIDKATHPLQIFIPLGFLIFDVLTFSHKQYLQFLKLRSVRRQRIFYSLRKLISCNRSLNHSNHFLNLFILYFIPCYCRIVSFFLLAVIQIINKNSSNYLL